MFNRKVKSKALDRRTFLRGSVAGSGVLLGLPVLESMLNQNGTALAGPGALPKRFISWFWGNGVNLKRFEPAMTPRASGPATEAWTAAADSPLADLTDVKDYINLCTGLMNHAEAWPTHHEGLTVFNGYTFDDATGPGISTNFAGPTIDQLIAATPAGAGTLVQSLSVGISKYDSPADSGTTADVISVAGVPGDLLPLYPITSPAQVWQTLFGPPPAPNGTRTSILDFVLYDIARLRPNLGANDQARMDDHLESIRQLEQRIETVNSCTAPAVVTEQNLYGNGSEPLIALNQLMADLTAVAFSCDLTRVASCLFLPVAGESFFSEVPTPGFPSKTAHAWSHDQREGYDLHIKFIMNRFGDWLRALKAIPEVGGGNLLDSTILFASSDCANGNHQIARQPILLGGRGRDYLQYPGVHYQAEVAPANPHSGNGTASGGNTSDVLLTCLQAFDPAATSVGDVGHPTESTTPLDEVRI